MTVQNISRKARPILRRYKVKKASLFGSYARGEERKNSDIDILFSPPKTMSLFGLVALKYELQDVLNKKVDIVPEGSEHAEISKSAKKDLVSIL